MNQLAMMGDAMKIGEMQRGIETQNKLRELYSQGVDVSTPEGFKQLAGVDPMVAMKLKNTAFEGRKLQAETGLKEFELDKNKIDKAITDISNHPTAQDAYADIQKRVQAGELPVDKANLIVGQLRSMPYEKFQMTQIRNLLSAKDRLTTEESQRHNKATEGIQALAYDPKRQGEIAAAKILAVGEAEASPSSAKGQAIAKGKNLVNDVATQMGDSYLKLQQAGGIKSTQKGAAANIAAASQSSMLGQLGGAALGTPEQAERDFIKSQRPILVQAIVKATGMSATQINSNVELKNLLDAATDPSKGYETNAKSLNLINKRFGTGAEVIPVNTGGGSNIDALLEKYK